MAPVAAVFEFYLVDYRRTWRGSIFSSFLLPVLTLLGFGVGLGAYVSGGVDGVPYLDWVVPGLIASTAANVAVADSTWPVLASFTWHRNYFAQAAAPLRVDDVLGGHLAFVVFRAIVSAAAFLAVAAAFGTLRSGWALAVLPIAGLLALAVAAPTFAYAASVSRDSYLVILFRFALLPMSLFSGVFFPIDALPAPLAWAAYTLPLWHGVELSRAATLGVAPHWMAVAHAFYLAGWAAAGWLLARARFRARLIV
jgi:lipooligosaccharide transport system permease protein